MAGFRRKKSRVGEAFQADIPPLLTHSKKEKEHRKYNEMINLSQNCNTLLDTSNGSSDTESNLCIDDTRVEHAIDTRVCDAQRSFNGFDFDYPFYVENYRCVMDDMIAQYHEHKSTSNRRSTRKKNIVNYAEWYVD